MCILIVIQVLYRHFLKGPVNRPVSLGVQRGVVPLLGSSLPLQKFFFGGRAAGGIGCLLISWQAGTQSLQKLGGKEGLLVGTVHLLAS